MQVLRDKSKRSLIVAWDTCTNEGVLAVGSENTMLAERYFRTEKGHTGRLMPLIDSTIKELGACPSDISAVAVGIGPGNFTGVKVGVATAKAMALALDIPLIGVPTLDILSSGPHIEVGLVLSVIDARRENLYAAAYHVSGGGLERVTDYLCMTVADLARTVTSLMERKVRIIGEAPRELVETLTGEGMQITVWKESHPDGNAMLTLAQEMLRSKRTGNAASVVPIYLKKPV